MRILIAEDNSVSRRMLEATLKKWGYEVVSTQDGNEAWEAIQQEDAPRLVILDWEMPGMDGVQVCQKVREQLLEPYVYIILLTAKDEKEDIIAGLDAGADDYVTKPFNAHELRVRLRTGQRIVELQEQLIAARDDLRFQATHDLLTGLWNRRAVFEILEREMARAQRAESAVGIIMADIDHFKVINDTYGHVAGDVVLGEVAQRMSRLIRSYDTIGRYGGEEFIIILPGCGTACAQDIAQRLRAGVSETDVATPDGAIPLTISIGVATTDETSLFDVDALVRAADAALYQAKRGGRNRVESVYAGGEYALCSR
jgi:diguanylate cyclase (GGDEF)-like protein